MTMTAMATTDRPEGGSLPSDGRIAVIAGSGSLPVNIADSLEAAGRAPLILLLEGEADRIGDLTRHEHLSTSLEAVGVAFDQLRAAGVTHAIMAGGVRRRPKLRRLRWTRRLVRILPKLAIDLALGDDGLLRAVTRHMEANGIRIVGAQEVVPDLLAQVGDMTQASPSRDDWRDIAAARQAAIAIGELDIGQAAIAIGGRAVALEGIEGTDGLLQRTIALRNHGRLAGKTGGVLAKCVKPQQELRLDLPGIGPETVSAAKAAGLRGIVLDAGHAFIMDFAETIARADREGLFITGIEVGR